MSDKIERARERLKAGDHQALNDIIDVMKDEKDFRYPIVSERRQQYMEAIAKKRGQKDEASATVAYWMQLAIFVMKISDPKATEMFYRLGLKVGK